MIKNLSEGFETAINSISRKPVQLMHFHINGQTCYLSDSPVGVVDGLAHDYNPIVESWGTLLDTSNIDNSFNGNSLEIKSIQLKFVITGESKILFLEALEEGVDNSQVEIYQWFASSPWEAPVLIDIMLAQDPIQWNDASSIFSVDCVSVIMRNNPYLWPRPVGAETRDIVVGEMPNMPLYDQQTSRKTTLSEDLSYDFRGPIYIANGVGFPGSGTVVIDGEEINYSWISASAINITGRGAGGTVARPHLRGALLFPKGSVFDYSICAGPVAAVKDLKAEGESYINPVTFLIDQDPVVARFYERPPWLKVVPGAGGEVIIPPEEQSTIFGTKWESDYDSIEAWTFYNREEINNSTSKYASMLINTGLGATVPTELQVQMAVLDTSDDIDPPWPTYGPRPAEVEQIKDYFDSDVQLYLYAYKEPLQNGITFVNFSLENIDDFINVTGPITEIDVTWDLYSGLPANVSSIDMLTEWYFVNMDGIEFPLLPSFTDYWYFSNNWNDPAWLSPHNPFTNDIHVKGSSFYPQTIAELVQCKIKLKVTQIRIDNNNLPIGGENYFSMGADLPIITVTSDEPAEPGVLSQPKQDIMSHFNQDLSYLGAIVSVSVTFKWRTYPINGNVTIRGVRRTTDDQDDNATVYEAQHAADTQQPWRETNVVLSGISNFTELKNTRFGVEAQLQNHIVEEGQIRTCTTDIEWIKWNITYQPGGINTPDEVRVVYAEDLTCTVTSNLGKDPTPAEVIHYLIEDHSKNGLYLDDAIFHQRHLEYYNDQYFFNGVFAGDIRLHEALKICLREGMARFLFAEGAIKLLNYKVYENISVDYEVEEANTILRTKKRVNQATSTITNDFVILYNYNPALDEFDDLEQVVDGESIVKFELHDNRVEFKLIRSQTVAARIAQHNIDQLYKPVSVVSFEMFMAAYPLQKGDRIQFLPMFSTTPAIGHISAIDRVFGQGKSSLINKFRIFVADAKKLEV